MAKTLSGMVKNMSDLYLSESGDLRVSSNGDIAFTETRWREDAQNAYIRIMTTPGDFVLYPSIGADLTKLYGMPQSKETADYGIELIKNSIASDGVFTGRSIDVTAVPTGPQTIRFDVKIKSGSRTENLISIEKDLGIDY